MTDLNLPLFPQSMVEIYVIQGNESQKVTFSFFTSQPAIWLLTLTLLYAIKWMQHIGVKN